jgi:hypothetical protein
MRPAAAISEVRTDSHGGFVLAGLADRPYTLVAWGRDRASRSELVLRSGPIQAGRKDVLLVPPDRDLPMSIAGRVVSSAGAPVAGARVGLGRPARSSTAGFYGMQGRFRTVSDADGRFELPAVPAGHAEIVVLGPSFLPARIELSNASDRREVVVRVRVRREFSLDTSSAQPPPEFARAIAGGTPAPLWRLDGAAPRTVDLLRLDDGRSGLVAVGDDVRELVLFRGPREIGRIPVSLDADRSTRIVWP